MTETSIIKHNIEPVWDRVASITDEIEDILKSKNIPFVSSAIIVVSELIENAVKYGERGPEKSKSKIQISVSVDENKIKIEASNFIYDPLNINNVIEHIEKIKECGDPSIPYIERLHQLLDASPSEPTRIGLYRIAYEGKFKIDYKFENNWLVIFAERSFS